MSERKYCKDCKWFDPWPPTEVRDGTCMRLVENLVVGFRPLEERALAERNALNPSACGEKGKYWEAKEYE